MTDPLNELLDEYRVRGARARKMCVDSSAMSLCMGAKAQTYEKVIADLELLLKEQDT